MSRKSRADKKKQVAPTVPMKLKLRIIKKARTNNVPIKAMCEEIVIVNIRNTEVIKTLSPHFIRGVLRVDNTMYLGHADNEPLPPLVINGLTGRVSMRFKRQDYEDIYILADLLDVSVSRVAGIILEMDI